MIVGGNAALCWAMAKPVGQVSRSAVSRMGAIDYLHVASRMWETYGIVYFMKHYLEEYNAPDIL